MHPATPQPRNSRSDAATMYAVVIGVSQFQQENIPPVQGARNDAEDFCKLLLELGVPEQNIKPLIDEQATRPKVEAAFRHVPDDANLKLIVYIATHGVLQQSRRGDVRGYILLHDSKIHGAFPEKPSPYLKQSPEALSTAEFLRLIQFTAPDQKLIGVDACYAGNAKWEEFGNKGASGESCVTWILGACGSRELAYEHRNGRFTAAMIEAIRRLWDRGQRFGTSLIHAEIEALLNDDPHFEGMQQPQLISYAGEGQFWFEPTHPLLEVSADTLRQMESQRLFEKAIAARGFGRFAKAYRLAAEAREHHRQPSDVDGFLQAVEREISNKSGKQEALNQIDTLLSYAQSALEREHLDQAERYEEAMRDIAKSASVALPGEAEELRGNILSKKSRAELKQAAEAKRQESLDRAWQDFGRAQAESRFGDALAVLEVIRGLSPRAPRIGELQLDLHERWRQQREEQAATLETRLVALVEKGEFDAADRLAAEHRELESYYPQWRKFVQALPVWHHIWEQVILPGRALAGEGKYAEALRLLDHLDVVSKTFPGLDRWRLEWRARAPFEPKRRLHWDSLYYVQLENGLWLSQTPVTVEAFELVMKQRGVKVLSRQLLREPIVERSYDDACDYCRKVGGRPPNSEEWILAASAHPEWCYPWKEISPELAHYGAEVPCEVGRFPLTPTGFYDLVGNVWEWCSDPPKGRAARTVRGGSFRSNAQQLRIDSQQERDPRRGYDDVGFRCLLNNEPRAKR